MPPKPAKALCGRNDGSQILQALVAHAVTDGHACDIASRPCKGIDQSCLNEIGMSKASIGMVRVARAAATVASCSPAHRMRSTRLRTSSSASRGRRSDLPFAKARSTRMFWPRIHPRCAIKRQSSGSQRSPLAGSTTSTPPTRSRPFDRTRSLAEARPCPSSSGSKCFGRHGTGQHGFECCAGMACGQRDQTLRHSLGHNTPTVHPQTVVQPMTASKLTVAWTHLKTSSARNRIESGTAIPSALAVCRLTTRS